MMMLAAEADTPIRWASLSKSALMQLTNKHTEKYLVHHGKFQCNMSLI